MGEGWNFTFHVGQFRMFFRARTSIRVKSANTNWACNRRNFRRNDSVWYLPLFYIYMRVPPTLRHQNSFHTQVITRGKWTEMQGQIRVLFHFTRPQNDGKQVSYRFLRQPTNLGFAHHWCVFVIRLRGRCRKRMCEPRFPRESKNFELFSVFRRNSWALCQSAPTTNQSAWHTRLRNETEQNLTKMFCTSNSNPAGEPPTHTRNKTPNIWKEIINSEQHLTKSTFHAPLLPQQVFFGFGMKLLHAETFFFTDAIFCLSEPSQIVKMFLSGRFWTHPNLSTTTLISFSPFFSFFFFFLSFLFVLSLRTTTKQVSSPADRWCTSIRELIFCGKQLHVSTGCIRCIKVPPNTSIHRGQNVIFCLAAEWGSFGTCIFHLEQASDVLNPCGVGSCTFAETETFAFCRCSIEFTKEPKMKTSCTETPLV